MRLTKLNMDYLLGIKLKDYGPFQSKYLKELYEIENLINSFDFVREDRIGCPPISFKENLPLRRFMDEVERYILKCRYEDYSTARALELLDLKLEWALNGEIEID